MALAPLAQTLLITASRSKIALSDAVTVPGMPTSSPSLSLSAAVTHAEGDSGTTNFVWTLTLDRDGSDASYAFSWATSGTGAHPAVGGDFVGGAFPSGSGTFAPGQTTKTITVPVAGDTTVESNKTFLLSVTAAGLNSPTSIGTITNDDTAPPTGEISDPVLAKTSTDPAQLAFSITADMVVGHYLTTQLAGDADFTTPLAGESEIREHTQIIIEQDRITGPVIPIMAGQPEGPVFARIKESSDEPAESGWSNVVSATVGASVEPDTPTEWESTPGIGKKSFVVNDPFEDDDPLTVGGQEGFNGAPCTVRAKNGRNGDRRMKWHVHYVPSSPLRVGFDNGSTNLNGAGYPVPGETDASGAVVKVTPSDWHLSIGGVVIATDDATAFGADCVADGDDIYGIFRDSDDTVEFYNVRGGVKRSYGGAHPCSLAQWFAIASFENSSAVTGVFDSSQGRPLESGVQYYDNL